MKASANYSENSPSRKIRLTLFAACASVFFITACVIMPQERAQRAFEDFIVVQPNAGDSLSALAAKYLSDSSKGWLIAEFNGIRSVTPGQSLIIPLMTLDRGGLRPDGYQTIPVLRYQKFSKYVATPTGVIESNFKAQMYYLKTNGYHVITLDQMLDFMDFKAQIPKKSVVITIDDGWRSTMEIAHPVLRRFGFPATLFVHPDFVDSKETLSWSELRLLAADGMDIQCAIRTHQPVSNLKDKRALKTYIQELDNELSRCKAVFQKELGQQCRYLAYPDGTANNIFVTLIQKHGFRAAFTLKGDSNPFFANNYFIHRTVMHGNQNLKQFQQTLNVFHPENLR